jgi:hypothetical protein
MKFLIKESKLFHNTWDVFVNCDWAGGIIYRNGKYSWYVCPQGTKKESGVEFSYGQALAQIQKSILRNQILFKPHPLNGCIVQAKDVPNNLTVVN